MNAEKYTNEIAIFWEDWFGNWFYMIWSEYCDTMVTVVKLLLALGASGVTRRLTDRY